MQVLVVVRGFTKEDVLTNQIKEGVGSRGWMAHPSGYQAIHSLPRGSKHSRRWWWHETAPTPAAHIPLLVYVRAQQTPI